MRGSVTHKNVTAIGSCDAADVNAVVPTCQTLFRYDEQIFALETFVMRALVAVGLDSR